MIGLKKLTRNFVLLGLALLLSACAQTPKPVVIEGSEDPRFEAAVEYWLRDDDIRSLPQLAALAAEGNTAARLLLGRIEVSERAPGAFVRSLTRTERMTLFRPPAEGRAFRSSWLRSEARAGQPLAQALDEALSLGVNLPAIQRLYALGEREAAEHLVIKIAIDGSQDEKDELAELMGAEADLLPYLRSFGPVHEPSAMGRNAFRHIRAVMGVSDPETLPSHPDADAAILFLGIGYQSGFSADRFSPRNRFYPLVSRWMERAPQTQPIVATCRRICAAEEVQRCAIVALGMTGGYYEAIRLDSPLENIIPQARYRKSERARATALRRVAFARSELLEELFPEDDIRARSICLADAVLEERAKR